MTTRDVPTWLRNLRELVGAEHGSLTRTAAKAHMKLQQLQRILAGANVKPQVDTLERLAIACGKTLDDLFVRPGNEPGRVASQLDPVLEALIERAAPESETWQRDVAEAIAALTRALQRGGPAGAPSGKTEDARRRAASDR